MLDARVSPLRATCIGSEEAAIRADPRQTGDPVIIGVFGVLG